MHEAGSQAVREAKRTVEVPSVHAHGEAVPGVVGGVKRVTCDRAHRHRGPEQLVPPHARASTWLEHHRRRDERSRALAATNRLAARVGDPGHDALRLAFVDHRPERGLGVGGITGAKRVHMPQQAIERSSRTLSLTSTR